MILQLFIKSLHLLTDAFYETPSTLDYNGIYKGYYIEFDAKNTNLKNLPLANIANHQIEHIKRIIKHNGIVFLLISIMDNIYVLNGITLIDFIDHNDRKSIPFDYIEATAEQLVGRNAGGASTITMQLIKNVYTKGQKKD